MSRIFLLMTGIYFATALPAQQNRMVNAPALLKELAATTKDSNRVFILRGIAESYIGNKNDSSLLLIKEALNLSRQINYHQGELESLFTMGKLFVYMGNYSRGLELYLQSLKISERQQDKLWITINLHFIGEVYSWQKDYVQSLRYYIKGKAIAESNGFNTELARILMNIGKAYESMGQTDSAGIYLHKSYELVKQDHQDDYLPGKILYSLGILYSKTDMVSKAMDFYRQSLVTSDKVADYLYSCNANLGIATLLRKMGETDSSLYYARRSLIIAKQAGFLQQWLNAASFLAEYFKDQRSFDSAFAYTQTVVSLKDSMISTEKIREFEKLTFSEEYRQQEIEQARLKYDNKVKIIILLSGLIGLFIVALVLWRNIHNKQKANKLLVAQKMEIDHQKAEIENSYKELKLTQAQLIQSEKMASLGELTAGIAHEIQNPLNFVNNFSEVSNELIEELKTEKSKPKNERSDEVEEELLNDIAQNLEKINHHGKRADGIVKGMLQHSRSSTGQKAETDINALADEYLRLAYHGLRAKDKSFNASMKTDFDGHLGTINIISQDIGRVILNLITNAFYSVTEKKNSLPEDDNYEPTVTVSTKKINNSVEIKVADNGNGVPQKVLDKIFQPFFTTKPAGQGTGLGLSMSYDIITKSHGGELKVKTEEAEGAEFIIILPLA